MIIKNKMDVNVVYPGIDRAGPGLYMPMPPPTSPLTKVDIEKANNKVKGVLDQPAL